MGTGMRLKKRKKIKRSEVFDLGAERHFRQFGLLKDKRASLLGPG